MTDKCYFLSLFTKVSTSPDKLKQTWIFTHSLTYSFVHCLTHSKWWNAIWDTKFLWLKPISEFPLSLHLHPSTISLADKRAIHSLLPRSGKHTTSQNRPFRFQTDLIHGKVSIMLSCYLHSHNFNDSNQGWYSSASNGQSCKYLKPSHLPHIILSCLFFSSEGPSSPTRTQYQVLSKSVGPKTKMTLPEESGLPST